MIDLPEDSSFDPLTDGGGQLDPNVVDDEAADAENRDHAALFAHVGVTDLTDWRSVALRLAERHAPDLLADPAKEVSRGTAGRPETRGPARMMALSFFINLIREASADGSIRGDLKSTRAICRYIAGNSSDAMTMRKMLELPDGISPRTIENLISKHQSEHPEWMARTTNR